jgi:hypothetical protein
MSFNSSKSRAQSIFACRNYPPAERCRFQKPWQCYSAIVREEQCTTKFRGSKTSGTQYDRGIEKSAGSDAFVRRWNNQDGAVDIPMSLQMKTTRYGLPFLLAVVAILGFAAVSHRATGSVPRVHYASEIAMARSHPYQATSTDLHPNEIPWVFDGKFPIHGKVLDSWNADTPTNKRSCDTTWANDISYIGFCRGLASNQIAAVLLTGIDGKSLAFVPANRIADLHAGDEVVIRIHAVSHDGSLERLPSLLNVVRWNKAGTRKEPN